jgi:2-(1,2-epoxy-1,2-dihydrophenyl)acetyl-CoA isomerase
MSEPESPLRYEVADGVATITLDRPQAMNALTAALRAALLDALRRAGSDDAVRAVLLTGSGRGFCVGQDLREHQQALEAGDGASLSTVREHYNPIVTEIVTVPKPVIAAVGGMAAGAGASLAFACDLRLASQSAAFLMAFARVGLGADTGASWTLQRLVGYGRAAAMLLLAEPVPAAQALEMGLVNEVVPDADLPGAARELAVRLAAGPTVAYGAIKEGLSYAASASLPDALEREADLQARCGATADHRAATEAFVAKQPPAFSGS